MAAGKALSDYDPLQDTSEKDIYSEMMRDAAEEFRGSLDGEEMPAGII